MAQETVNSTFSYGNTTNDVDADTANDQTQYEEGMEVDEFDGQDAENYEDEEAGEETQKDMYNEEEYMAEVGEMNCYCVPSRVYGFKDFLYRTMAWFLLNKEQILTAITVAITQIPEAISTALIAGVNPGYALQATWIMNILTSLIGGRPGMISGSTTFVGIALARLVEKDGPEYIFYAVMFAGFLQINFGLLGLGALTRFIPYPVVQGFSNAMALVILAAQFRFGKIVPDETFYQRNLVEAGYSWEHIIGKDVAWVSGMTIVLMAVHGVIAFAICFGLPKLTRMVPSAFVAMFVCTFIEQVVIRLSSDHSSATIGDYSIVKTELLIPIWIDKNIEVPGFNLDTLRKVYLPGLAVFGSGICESLLTKQIVDELTEIKGDRGRVALGQGVANIVAACFGGMGGSASIGQSVLANHSDGITSLSTFLSGAFMVLFVYVAYDFINLVPLGAVAGIMGWTALNLIDWESILQAIAAILPLRLRDKFSLDCKVPRADILIMLSVMAFTICLDLSIGLLSGVLIAGFVYVWDSSTRVIVEREISSDEATSVTYNITGPLFYATAGGFSDIFPVEEVQFDPDEVVLLLEGAEVYDYSGMVALKKVYDRFADLGKVVALSSLTPTSRRLMEKSAYMWQGVNFLEVEEVDQSVAPETDPDQMT
jgi:SulP family sulfate permease